MLSLALAFILFFIRAQQKIATEKLRRQQMQLEHQEQLLYNNFLVQEQERKRIAKDLHDEVGSKLNLANLNLDRLQKIIPPEASGSKDTLEDLFSMLNDAMSTTRRISHDLLPPTLENFGLHEAIKELCDNYKYIEDVTIKYTCTQYLTPEPKRDSFRMETYSPPLDPGTEKLVEVHFFRVLQELITNSIKHAQATQITILLSQTPHELRLAYTDNGQGFVLEEKQGVSGLGLQNMESRMRMVGATLLINTKPGEGFTASLTHIHKT